MRLSMGVHRCRQIDQFELEDEVQAMAWATASSADSTMKTHFPPSQPFQMKHVFLDLVVDLEAKRLSGRANHSLVSRADGLDQIVLHSSRLTIHGVEVNGAAVDFEVEEEAVEVSLEPVAAGTSLEVSVEYECVDPPKGIFFVGPTEAEPDRPPHAWTHGEPEDNRWWFPSYDAPNSPVTCEAKIRVKKPLEAFSNGKLVETIENDDGTRTFHWKLDRPHANYLVNLIVGEFDRIEEEVDGIVIRSRPIHPWPRSSRSCTRPRSVSFHLWTPVRDWSVWSPRGPSCATLDLAD